MRESHASVEIFREPLPDGSVVLHGLVDAGQTIQTITTTTSVLHDAQDHAPFYAKPIDTVQYAQLQHLRSLGLPVPRDIAMGSSGERFATSDGGVTLSRVLAEGSMEPAVVMRQAGSLLRTVHQCLSQAVIPDDVLLHSYHSSAHIVDNFAYKHWGNSGQTSQTSYEQHKRGVLGTNEVTQLPNNADFIPDAHRMPSGLQDLVACANEAARHYFALLEPRIRKNIDTGDHILEIPDQGLCYGDFKPDNLLCTTDANGKVRITLIDPLLRRGSAYFDLAKFTSRSLLRNPELTDTSVVDFFAGYGEQPQATIPVFGPYRFQDLVAMDTLNILRSYAKRIVVGDRNDSSVQAFDSPEYCQSVMEILNGLMRCDTNHALDNLVTRGIR